MALYDPFKPVLIYMKLQLQHLEKKKKSENSTSVQQKMQESTKYRVIKPRET